MEGQHRGIAEGVASVQDIVASWVASGDEGRRLMANVPLPKRVLALLVARRACAIYRRKIYG